MTPSRSIAFGDVEAGIWGVAWTPDTPGQVSVAIGAGAEAEVIPATLSGVDHTEDWRLDGDGLELVLSASTPPFSGGGPATGLNGFDQLCRASGHLTLAGARELDGLGWRSTQGATIDLERIESFRQVSAWFEADDGLALIAMRPRKARGQESDLVTAAVTDPEQTPPVADPRLSTTYDEAGVPFRAGLELWFEESIDVDPEDEEPPAHFPRRAAGEALSAGIRWTQDGFELHAAPFQWHSRGRDGAGVYLLGRRS